MIEEQKNRFNGRQVSFSEFNTVISDANPILDQDKVQQIDKKTLREVIIYNQTVDNVRKALRQLKQDNVKIIRPNDYYAEMIKSD